MHKIRLKWKLFFIFLAFVVVLLSVLWFFQIGYLGTFYKQIKAVETRAVVNEAVQLLNSEDVDVAQSLDELAASENVAILVTDSDGELLFNAEYIPNSKMNSIPRRMFFEFYEDAKAAGGETVAEFKGSDLREETDRIGEMFFYMEEHRFKGPNSSENGGVEHGYSMKGFLMGDPEGEHFRQNVGNAEAESMVYVKILNVNGSERVLMVNSVLTPVDATVSTLKKQLWIISIIMIVVAVLAGFITSRVISGSLGRMNESAKKLAAGDYSVTFDSRDYLEVAQLSDTLNFAAAELNKTEGFQRELLANVSHDLRTPLTMISGYAEVMRDLPGENTPENVQIIIDETERLTGLVNDMLDISKLKAGVISIEKSRYNLTKSIASVLERYNKLQEQEGYSISFEYETEAWVEADEAKIYQVLYNLINNAINYTGDDKKVIVRQSVREGKVTIDVIDSGDGVSPENLPYVWDRYYKVDKAHKRAIKGTGLGLSICKNILILHEADYGVYNNTAGGATFFFRMPVV